MSEIEPEDVCGICLRDYRFHPHDECPGFRQWRAGTAVSADPNRSDGMDYREVLKRYVALIVDREGDSLWWASGYHKANLLTAEDVAAIREIEAEVNADEELATQSPRHAPA